MVAVVAGSGLGLLETSQVANQGRGDMGQAGLSVNVNAVTGNLVLQSQDELLVSKGIDSRLIRTYNSLGQIDGDNNDGHRFSFQQRVKDYVITTAGVDEQVTLVRGDGHESIFYLTSIENGSKIFTTTDGDGAHDTLVLNQTATGWTFTEGSSRLEESFDWDSIEGKLVAYRDADGFETTLTYEDGFLVGVIDASGETLNIEYYLDAQNNKTSNVKRVSTVVNGVTQAATYYEYETQGLNRLVKVITDLTPEDNLLSEQSVLDASLPGIYTTEYFYKDGSSHLIEGIRQSDGTEIHFTYEDVEGELRIKTVTEGTGSDEIVTTYDYNIAIGLTDIHQSSAGQTLTTSVKYDAFDRVTQVLTPATEQGQRLTTTYGYDEHDNITWVRDARNLTTYYSYDANGNLLKEQSPEGTTITRSYSDTNQLISETVYQMADADTGSAQVSETHYFIYDDEERLRFAVAADGSVIETRYDDTSGDRIISKLYYGEAVDESVALTLSELQIWAAAGRTVLSREDTQLDFRHQVSSVTTYSRLNGESGDISQADQSVTHFVYDQHGRLLKTIDARGTANDSVFAKADNYETNYLYDGLGRLISTIDAAGNTTITRYNGSVVESRFANGLVTTNAYNSSGLLVSTTQAYGTATSTANATQHIFHDDAARITYIIAENGQVKAQYHDIDGNVIDEKLYIIDVVGIADLFSIDSVADIPALLKPYNLPTGVELFSNLLQHTFSEQYDEASGSLKPVLPQGDIAGAYTDDLTYQSGGVVSYELTVGNLLPPTHRIELGFSDILAVGLLQPSFKAVIENVGGNIQILASGTTAIESDARSVGLQQAQVLSAGSTTYVVEYELSDTYVDMYVYEKEGGDRATGFTARAGRDAVDWSAVYVGARFANDQIETLDGVALDNIELGGNYISPLSLDEANLSRTVIEGFDNGTGVFSNHIGGNESTLYDADAKVVRPLVTPWQIEGLFTEPFSYQIGETFSYELELAELKYGQTLYLAFSDFIPDVNEGETSTLVSYIINDAGVYKITADSNDTAILNSPLSLNLEEPAPISGGGRVYVVEYEMQEDYVAMYVYLKGQDRASGFIARAARPAADWPEVYVGVGGYNGDAAVMDGFSIDNFAFSGVVPAAIAEPDAVRTEQYIYDHIGNLRARIQPDGSIYHYLYNAAGQPLAEVDATGAITVNAYNNNHQIVHTTQFANRLTAAQFEELSIQVRRNYFTFVDASEWLMGVLGQNNFSNVDEDRSHDFVYNADGQLIYSIDAESYLTEYQYDGKGQRIETIRYDQPLSVEERAEFLNKPINIEALADSTTPMGAIQIESNGKLIFDIALDAYGRGIVTEYRHDEYDNITSKRTYEQSIAVEKTLTEQDVRDAVSTLSYQVAFHKFYIQINGESELQYAIDENGKVTEYTYDALGYESEVHEYDRPILSEAVETLADLQQLLIGTYASNYEDFAVFGNDAQSQYADSYELDEYGRLQIKNAYATTESQAFSQGVKREYRIGTVYRSEVTTLASLDKLNLFVGVTSAEQTNLGADYHGIKLSADGFVAVTSTDSVVTETNLDGVVNFASNSNGISLNPETRYIVELEINAAGTQLFVYEKGSDRNSGITHQFDHGKWSGAKSINYTVKGPDYFYVPDIPVYKSFENANGDLHFTISEEGSVQEYLYDENNQLYRVVEFANKIDLKLIDSVSNYEDLQRVYNARTYRTEDFTTFSALEQKEATLLTGSYPKGFEVEGNRLKLISTNQEQNGTVLVTDKTFTYPGKYAGEGWPGNEGWHAEFTTTNSVGNLDFTLGIRNSDVHNTGYHRLAARIVGGELEVMQTINFQHTYISTGYVIKENTRYVVEAELRGDGAPTIFVYEDGLTRDDGYTYTFSNGKWWGVQFEARVNYGVDKTGDYAYLEGFYEYNISSSLPGIKDVNGPVAYIENYHEYFNFTPVKTFNNANGQLQYEIDGNGAVRETIYDANGQIIDIRTYNSRVTLESDASVTGYDGQHYDNITSIYDLEQELSHSEYYTFNNGYAEAGPIGDKINSMVNSGSYPQYQFADGGLKMSSEYRSGSTSPRIYAFGGWYGPVGQGWKTEFTLGPEVDELYFGLGLERNSDGGNWIRRHRVIIKNNQFYLHRYHRRKVFWWWENYDNLSPTGVAPKPNQTYVVEHHAINRDGVMRLYVYEKGQTKADAFLVNDYQYAWNAYFDMWTNSGPGYQNGGQVDPDTGEVPEAQYVLVNHIIETYAPRKPAYVSANLYSTTMLSFYDQVSHTRHLLSQDGEALTAIEDDQGRLLEETIFTTNIDRSADTVTVELGAYGGNGTPYYQVKAGGEVLGDGFVTWGVDAGEPVDYRSLTFLYDGDASDITVEYFPDYSLADDIAAVVLDVQKVSVNGQQISTAAFTLNQTTTSQLLDAGDKTSSGYMALGDQFNSFAAAESLFDRLAVEKDTLRYFYDETQGGRLAYIISEANGQIVERMYDTNGDFLYDRVREEYPYPEFITDTETIAEYLGALIKEPFTEEIDGFSTGVPVPDQDINVIATEDSVANLSFDYEKTALVLNTGQPLTAGNVTYPGMVTKAVEAVDSVYKLQFSTTSLSAQQRVAFQLANQQTPAAGYQAHSLILEGSSFVHEISTYDEVNNVVVTTTQAVPASWIPEANSDYTLEVRLEDGKTVFYLFKDGAQLGSQSDLTGTWTGETAQLSVTTKVHDAGDNTQLLINQLLVSNASVAVADNTYSIRDVYLDGRIAYTISNLGDVVELIYDRKGNVIEQRGYTLNAPLENLENKTDQQLMDEFVPQLSALRYASVTSINLSTNNNIEQAKSAAETWLSSLTETSDIRRTRNFYNSDGQIAAELDAEGYLTEYNYNIQGELVSTVRYSQIADVLNPFTGEIDLVKFELAALDDIRPTDSLEDQRVSYVYNAKGQKTATIQMAGVSIDGSGQLNLNQFAYVTEYTYDLAGNLLQTLAFDEAWDFDTYQSFVALHGEGQGHIADDVWLGIKPVFTASSQVTENLWDARNLLIANKDINGIETHYKYNASGQLIEESVAVNSADTRTTQWHYNAFGELDESVSPEAAAAGVSVTNTYDENKGLLLSSEDELGHRTLFYYNDRGELAYKINAEGEVTGYEYNTFGETVATHQYANAISSATLDSMTGGVVDSAVTSLLPAKTAADIRTESSYTRMGQLDQLFDANAVNAGATVATLDYDYNAFGEVSQLTKAVRNASGVIESRITTNAYSTRGLLLAANQADSATGRIAATQNIYNAFGQLIVSSDANGQIRDFSYDAMGRLIRSSDALGNQQFTRYDAFSRTLEVSAKSANGWQTTRYAYNDAERSHTVTTAAGIQTKTTNNEFGQAATVELLGDEAQVLASYRYDNDGQLIESVDSAGESEQRFYDAAGNLDYSISKNGVITDYSYDAANRLLSTTVDPAGLDIITEYELDNFGRTVKQTRIGDANTPDRVTVTNYDDNGNVSRVIQDAGEGGLNLVTAFTYDLANNLIKKQQGEIQGVTASSAGTAVYSRTSVYEYDAFGHLTAETVDATTDGLNITTRFTYDDNGNQIRMTDANGAITHQVFDANNRLRFVLAPYSDNQLSVTEYRYDAKGMQTDTLRYYNTVTAPLDSTLQDGINAFDESLAVTSHANDQRSRQVFDNDGHLRFSINANHEITEYKYNDRGLVEASYQFALKLDDLYLADGVVSIPEQISNNDLSYRISVFNLYIAENTQTQRYFYDAAGRQTFHIDALGYVTETQYDVLGNVTVSIRFADALQTPETATATTLGALQEDSSKDQINRYFYDAVGRQTYHINAESFISAQLHDAVGDVVKSVRYAQPVTFVEGMTSADLDVLYLSAGDLIVGSQDQSDEYIYDAAGQLRYHKDSLGYITETQYNETGQVTRTERYADYSGEFTATALSALVSTSINRISNNVYDAAGRLIESYQGEIADGIVTTYGYDTLGNRITVTDKNGNTTYYSYDAAGRLKNTFSPIQQQADLQAGEQLYGYLSSISYDAFGNKTSETYYVNKLAMTPTTPATNLAETVNPVANNDTVTINGQTVSVGDRTTTYTYDALNRISTITDASGTVHAQSYDAFGNLIKEVVAQGTSDERVTLHRYDLNNHRTHTLAGVNPTAAEQQNFFAYYDSSPDLQVTEYQYDAFGQVTGIVDARAMEYIYANSEAAQAYRNGFEVTGDPRLNLADHQALINGLDPVAYLLNDAQRTAVKKLFTHVQTYDLLGQKIAETNAENQTSISEMDAFGNIIKSIDANGNAGYFFYNNNNELTYQIDPEGYVSAFKYDYQGRVDQQFTYANKLQVSLDETATTADIEAAIAAVEDVMSDQQQTFIYNALGQLENKVQTIVDDQGGVSTYTETFVYDNEGYLIAYTDQNQNQWTYKVDVSGNRIEETTPDVDVSVYDADTRQFTTVTLPLVHQYDYDRFGNKVMDIMASNLTSYLSGTEYANDLQQQMRVTEYVYDVHNRLVEQKNPSFTDTTFGDVDGLGGVQTTINPVIQKAYDAVGNLTLEIDEQGNKTHHYYNANNQRIATVDSESYLHAFDFDGVGNMTAEVTFDDKVTMPANGSFPDIPQGESRIVRYAYNKVNQRVSKTTEETLVYNLPPLVEGEIDPDLDLVDFSTLSPEEQAELVGRLPPELVSYYVRTNGGYETKAIVNEYIYDATGNVIQSIDGRGNSKHFFFDQVGNLRLLIDEDGYVIERQYDNGGQMTLEHKYATPINTADLFDVSGSRKTLSEALTLLVGNANADRATAYSYDNLGRLRAESVLDEMVSSLTAKTVLDTGDENKLSIYAAGSDQYYLLDEQLQDVTTAYQYDGTGNVTQITAADNSIQSFAYNALGQQVQQLGAEGNYLTAIDTDADSQTIDTYGTDIHNRRSHKAYQYNAFGELLVEREYSLEVFDAEGNLDEIASQWRSRQSIMDEAGNQITTVDYNGNYNHYRYDEKGQVVGRQWFQSDYNISNDPNQVTTATPYDETYEYDSLGRETLTVDAAGVSQATQYNAHGEITAKGSYTGTTVQYQQFWEYDALGNVFKTNADNGSWRAYVYDENGNATIEMQAIETGVLDGLTQTDVVNISPENVSFYVTRYNARNQQTDVYEPPMLFSQLKGESTGSNVYIDDAIRLVQIQEALAEPLGVPALSDIDALSFTDIVEVNRQDEILKQVFGDTYSVEDFNFIEGLTAEQLDALEGANYTEIDNGDGTTTKYWHLDETLFPVGDGQGNILVDQSEYTIDKAAMGLEDQFLTETDALALADQQSQVIRSSSTVARDETWAWDEPQIISVQFGNYVAVNADGDFVDENGVVVATADLAKIVTADYTTADNGYAIFVKDLAKTEQVETYNVTDYSLVNDSTSVVSFVANPDMKYKSGTSVDAEGNNVETWNTPYERIKNVSAEVTLTGTKVTYEVETYVQKVETAMASGSLKQTLNETVRYDVRAEYAYRGANNISVTGQKGGPVSLNFHWAGIGNYNMHPYLTNGQALKGVPGYADNVVDVELNVDYMARASFWAVRNNADVHSGDSFRIHQSYKLMDNGSAWANMDLAKWNTDSKKHSHRFRSPLDGLLNSSLKYHSGDTIFYGNGKKTSRRAYIIDSYKATHVKGSYGHLSQKEWSLTYRLDQDTSDNSYNPELFTLDLDYSRQLNGYYYRDTLTTTEDLPTIFHIDEVPADASSVLFKYRKKGSEKWQQADKVVGHASSPRSRYAYINDSSQLSGEYEFEVEIVQGRAKRGSVTADENGNASITTGKVNLGSSDLVASFIEYNALDGEENTNSSLDYTVVDNLDDTWTMNITGAGANATLKYDLDTTHIHGEYGGEFDADRDQEPNLVTRNAAQQVSFNVDVVSRLELEQQKTLALTGNTEEVIDVYGGKTKVSEVFDDPYSSSGALNFSIRETGVIQQDYLASLTDLNNADVIHKAYSYNAFGEVESESDIRSATETYVTEYHYDKRGNQIEKLTPETDVYRTGGSFGDSGASERSRISDRYYYDALGNTLAQQQGKAIDIAQGTAGYESYEIEGRLSLQQFENGRVVTQVAADGGEVFTSYDRLGNKRLVSKTVDANFTSQRLNTRFDYDANGNLITQYHASDFNGNSTGITDTYTYDAEGNRLTHTNAENDTETYRYDGLGRVTEYNSFAGRQTQYSYQFFNAGEAMQEGDNTITTNAGAAVWRKTETQMSLAASVNDPNDDSVRTILGLKDATTPTLIDDTDLFGKLRYHKDLGDQEYTYTYNGAGWLQSQQGSTGKDAVTGLLNARNDQNITYDYYTNGYLKSVFDTGGYTMAYYEYDKNGNRTVEKYADLATDGITLQPAHQVNHATYDELGRLKTVEGFVNPFTINYTYDANGNRLAVNSTYSEGENVNSQSQDLYYRYDEKNRFTLTMGSKDATTGELKAEEGGYELTYNYLDWRLSADSRHQESEEITDDNGTPGETTDDFKRFVPIEGSYIDSSERYTYDAAGRVKDVFINGTLRSSRLYNKVGTQTDLFEFDDGVSGGLKALTHKIYDYDQDNLLLSTKDMKSDSLNLSSYGTYTYTQGLNIYSYVDNDSAQQVLEVDASGDPTEIVYLTTTNDYLADGTLKHVNRNYHGNDIDSDTYYGYEAWDSFKEKMQTISADASDLDYKPDGEWLPGESFRVYDANGHLVRFDDMHGGQYKKGRSILYRNSHNGRPLYRTEYSYLSDRQSVTYNSDAYYATPTFGGQVSGSRNFYYINGKAVGDKGTGDVPSRVDYAQSLANVKDKHTDIKDRVFHVTSVDFDQSYQPINADYPGGAAGSYTVKQGDTLQSIAASLWGDGSLWYLLADANGLAQNATLVEGARLTTPNVVANQHNNADTLRPFNPSLLLGDTSPTLPNPPPPKKDKCAMVKAIITVIVVVLVSVYTAGAATAALSTAAGATSAGVAAAGAAAATAGTVAGVAATSGALMAGAVAMAGAFVGGVMGSLAGQLVGMGMGTRDDLSWSEMRDAGWSKAATAGVDFAFGDMGAGLNADISQYTGGGGFATDFAQAAASSVVSGSIINGMGIADFDWHNVFIDGATNGIMKSSNGQKVVNSLSGGGKNVFMRELTSGAIRESVRKNVMGDDFDYVGVAGNAIGQYVADEINIAEETAAIAETTPELEETYERFRRNGGDLGTFQALIADDGIREDMIYGASLTAKAEQMQKDGKSSKDILFSAGKSTGNTVNVDGKPYELVAPGLAYEAAHTMERLQTRFVEATDGLPLDQMMMAAQAALFGPAVVIKDYLVGEAINAAVGDDIAAFMDYSTTKLTSAIHGLSEEQVGAVIGSQEELKNDLLGLIDQGRGNGASAELDAAFAQGKRDYNYSKDVQTTKTGSIGLVGLILLAGGLAARKLTDYIADKSVSRGHVEAEVEVPNSAPTATRDANGVLRTSDGRYATDPSTVSSQLNRPSLRSQTKATIDANAPKNSQGQFIDQNGQVLTDTHYGHIAGHENRRILAAGDELGLSQSQLNDYVNARPEFFKIEDAKRNLSHADEMPGRDNIDHIIIDMEDFFGL